MTTDLEPYRIDNGDLVTTGDVRQDLRNRTTDSWTDVVGNVALFAQQIAPTEFVPKGLRNNPAAVTGAIMYGREVGFPPMTALQVLHNIEGKVSMSSEGQRALVLQAGHEIITVESTSAKCTMKGRRKGSDEWTQTTWTIDDARQAGLVRKDNWSKYPKAMLVARASADLCRLAFPDVIRGLMSVEELEDVVAISGGEVPDGPEEPTQVQRKTRKRAAPVKKADAPEEPLPEDGSTPQTGEVDTSPPLPDDAPTPLGGSQDAVTHSTAGGSDDDGGVAVAEPSEPPSPEVAAGSQAGAESGAASGFESQPAPATPDEDVVDAEVVDDPAEAEPRVDPGQRAKLMSHVKRLDIEDRTERLYTFGMLVGRTLKSANDLSASEASMLLSILEKCRDAAALQELVIAAGEKGGA